MGKSHKDICFPRERSPRVTLAEGDFTQGNRMTHSVDTGQLLSPVNPVITQRAHEQSGYGGRDGGYARAQQHGLLLTKVNLATATAKCPICQHQRPIRSPRCDTIPWKDQPATYLVVGK